jgi:Zn finger protein HypA/HybF involved in hydrogenase expression
LNFKSEESYQRVLDAQKRGRETVKINNKLKEEEYYKNPKPCKRCGCEISYEKRKNKFCSRSCGASYNNIGINRHVSVNGKDKKRFCLFCGSELKRNKKYCSFKCLRALKHKEYVEDLENNIITSKVILRRYLMVKYDFKCQKCGWGIPNPVSGTVCLDMHHIDGDADNNVLSNVELLCPNCHSLTDTYKNVDNNRKSTRINRKK